jgi:hypothetical protein
MAVREQPLPINPAGVPEPKRFRSRLNPKKWLNRFAAKALESADVVLGSIPIAEVASEIKDVALIAIKD